MGSELLSADMAHDICRIQESRYASSESSDVSDMKELALPVWNVVQLEIEECLIYTIPMYATWYKLPVKKVTEVYLQTYLFMTESSTV